VAEEDYYKPIQEKLEGLFRAKVNDPVYFEITASGKFSNSLKSKIPNSINIIFTFLKGKELAPDITGYIQRSYSSDFIIVEIKDKPIKIDHIYQTRKYFDLFQAKFAFLISTCEIPEEIKRLYKENYRILSPSSTSSNFTLVWFDKKIKEFRDWFPENSFEKELYWR
jgi:hypothetical protein